MKKTKILLWSIGLLAMNASAQLNIVSKDNYGVVHDVNFVPSVPNKLIARTEVNHLVSSNDKGQTWEIFYDDAGGYIYNLRVSNQNNYCSFFVEHGSAPIIYVMDLETNAIIKSYNLQSLNMESVDLLDYQLFPADPNILMVIAEGRINGDFGRRFKITYDGGQTWENFYTYDSENIILPTDCKLDEINPNKIYLTFNTQSSGNEHGGVRISENGGETYTTYNADKFFKKVYTFAERPNEIWAIYQLPNSHSEQIMKSTDGGTTWDDENLDWDGGQSQIINYIEVNPNDADHIMIMESDEIAISYDGGQTFTITKHIQNSITDYYNGDLVSFNPANKEEFVFRNNSVSLITLDNGQSFNFLVNSYENTLNNVIVEKNDDGEHMIYGVRNGYVYVNDDANIYFEQDVLQYGEHSFESTQFNKDRHQQGTIFVYQPNVEGHKFNVSFDYGQTLHHLHTGYIGKMVWTYTNPNYKNTVWTYHYDEGGNVGELKKIDYNDLENNNIIIEPLVIPYGDDWAWGIAVDKNDPTKYLIARRNEIYKTNNGGFSFELAMTGFPQTQSHDKMGDFVMNPFDENELFMATSVGVFKTNNFSQSWTQLNNISAHKIYPSDKVNGHLVAVTNTSAATHLKIAVSSNAGESWETFNFEELGYVLTTNWNNSNDVYFDEDKAHVYIASADVGVVKFEFDLENLTVSEPIFVSQSSIRIYPNPTSDVLNISSKEEIETINIFDLTGKKVISSAEKSISVAHLPKGNYTLSVKHKNGKISSEKFIKK